MFNLPGLPSAVCVHKHLLPSTGNHVDGCDVRTYQSFSQRPDSSGRRPRAGRMQDPPLHFRPLNPIISATRQLGRSGLSEECSLSESSPHLMSAHSQCPWHHSEWWKVPPEELPASYRSKEPRQHGKFSLETDSVEESTHLELQGCQLEYGGVPNAAPTLPPCTVLPHQLCTGKSRFYLKTF